MDEGYAEEGVYEVEDLLEWQSIDGKDHYLVKWKGYADTSWEPDENIGQELAELKAAARQRSGGETKRRRDKEKKEKKDKKKKRRRGSSEDKKKDSDSDSSSPDDVMHGLPGLGMMPGMPPGMPPGMAGMMPGMMPGFGPEGMMPGMMPGMMMMMGDPMGKGKMMGPMPPMMMKGKGMPGKGPMPPWPFDPMGKGMPPMMGKGKPFMKGGFFGGKPGMFPPLPAGVNREALDTQRFAVERKRRLREFAGALHSKLASDPAVVPAGRLEHTKEFQEAIGLQLEDNQLPVLAPSELVVVDALWLLWLFDPQAKEQDMELLMKLAKVVRGNGPEARQLLLRCLKAVWPKPFSMPSGGAVQLFSLLGNMLPKAQAYPQAQGPMPYSHAPLPPVQEHVYRPAPDGNNSKAEQKPAKKGDDAEAAKSNVEKYKQLISEIYAEHNKEKLGEIDEILKKYEGKEKALYVAICTKYSVEPKQLGSKKKKKAGGDGGQPLEYWKELITKLYAEHNPAKLSDVETLLNKYKGREQTLYLSICEKYKVQPLPEAMQPAAAPAAAGHPMGPPFGMPPGMPPPGMMPPMPMPGMDSGLPFDSFEYWRELITRLYLEHNPAKLSDVDTLLHKYRGREKTLYLGICSKYHVPPRPEVLQPGGAPPPFGMPPGMPPMPGMMPPMPGMGEAGPPPEYWKDLISKLYSEHNPAKLSDVETLLNKYKGRERTLYLSICEKYKVPPRPEVLQQPPAGMHPGMGGPGMAPPSVAPPDGQPPAASQPSLPLMEVDQEWLNSVEEPLSRLLELLVSSLVLHTAGLRADDAKGLSTWERARRKPPPRSLSHRFELTGLSPSKVGQLAKELHGDDDVRWRKLQERCEGVELRVPPAEAQRAGDDGAGAPRALSVFSDGGGPKGRRPFDSAVLNLTDALSHAVRECLDASEGLSRFDQWTLPWSGEEVAFVALPSASENGNSGDGKRKEVAVEYRRGCWTLKRRPPLHAHSIHHNLCGPDVEARLPQMWRELADKLWMGVISLKWGAEVPLDAVVMIEACGGHEACQPGPGMRLGCSAAAPSASVVITAPTGEELEQAKAAVAPILARVLSDLRANALFAPTSLCMPQMRGPLALPGSGLGILPGRDFGRGRARSGASSSSSSEDEVADAESEEVMSDVDPSEGYRPIRLPREKVRDAYLQGLLCLNCDAADHKHQECAFRKKVCWNCHGNHPGNDCPMRCRFCKDKHDYPVLECVKRVCRRVSDWKKSKPAMEQKNVLSNFEQLMIKVEGFADFDLAKHNKEIQKMVKELAELHALWPSDLEDLATSILDMKPPQKKAIEPVTPPPPPGPPPKPYAAPKLPKEPPPSMPENKYPWSEKIFLDNLLARGMYGSNVLSRIIGRGGSHHRRMETESGARVFFRGLGVSGRDAELTEPLDCRLHIAVKGEVPQQGRSVRRIVAEILSELDAEIAEKGEVGPRLDRPRDPDLHPFGFLLPKGLGPEGDGPLKFKFPEEDGQTLNDLLVWLKQAKLPLELDSDTQWRTTLQVTPTDPPLPDDAPEGSDTIVDAFMKVLDEWHHPSPYWFEEQDLRPTGLWTALTAGEAEDVEGLCPIALQMGQGVRLSAPALSRFALLLDQADLAGGASRATVETVLGRLRGVVRRQAEDEQLLLFLAYPWAWFAESMGRGGLRLPFGKERVHEMLVELGRIGGKPTESCPSPPFRGFSIEWMPLKAGAAKAPAAGAVSSGAPTPPPVALPPVQEPVPALPWGAPAPAAPPPFTPLPPVAVAAAPLVPGVGLPEAPAAAPRGYCKCWLPDAIFSSGQDLHELIAGPGGAHFAHVLKKYPSVELRVDGQASLAAPPAHRLHVVMSSEDSEVFESAAADVLDLVETVCDMVGEEVGLNEEQVEALIQGIRAEKYFEAHGIRTPLPPVKSRSAAAAPPAVPGAVAAPAAAGQAPAAQPPGARAAAPEGDFEFVDDDLEADQRGGDAGDGDDTEDDARTEASDCLSDITEDDAPRAPGDGAVFDDI